MKVERRAVKGAAWRFKEALNNSEDILTWNTSFIERVSLIMDALKLATADVLARRRSP